LANGFGRVIFVASAMSQENALVDRSPSERNKSGGENGRSNASRVIIGDKRRCSSFCTAESKREGVISTTMLRIWTKTGVVNGGISRIQDARFVR
jgi:hypothetical protein